MSDNATVALMERLRACGVSDLEMVSGFITAMSDQLATAGDDRKALMEDVAAIIVRLRSARELVRDREAYTLADEALHTLTSGAPEDIIEWMRKTRGPPGGGR